MRAMWLAVAVLLAGAAQAAPAEPGCRTLLTDAVMDRCIGDRYDAQKALDAVMRRLLFNIPAADRAPLTAAERAWETYRDRACAWEAHGKSPDVRDACLVRLMRGRIKELTQIAVGP